MTKTFCEYCKSIIDVDYYDYPFVKQVRKNGKKVRLFFCGDVCKRKYKRQREKYKILGIKDD